jgi:hypothetical protein
MRANKFTLRVPYSKRLGSNFWVRFAQFDALFAAVQFRDVHADAAAKIVAPQACLKMREGKKAFSETHLRCINA